MNIKKTTKYSLLTLLILLNILMRCFAADHELMSDSFEMHIMANSLSQFGEARWWESPLSIAGYFPNSYASAISFFLSGFSQISGINIESTIFIYSIIFGIFSIFTSYVLAGRLYNDDLYKFLVAFIFSLSPGILAYTTWTAHARSPFIIILPLFIYSVLKLNRDYFKFGLITLILLLFLFSTHHLFFYTLPILVSYLIINFLYNSNIALKKCPPIITYLFLLSAFLLFLAFPFLTHKFMTIGSRWDNLILIFREYPRYIGIPVFMAIGGFVSLFFKSNKKYEEWFLLAILIMLTVFIFETRYMKWFILIFAMLLAGIGFSNISRVSSFRKNYTILVVILLISVSFSGYFQYLHVYEKDFGDKYIGPRYISEHEFFTSLWINDAIKGNLITNSRWVSFKMAAISGNVFLTGSYVGDQIYGLVTVSDYELEMRPITSEEFYMNSPYKVVNGTDSDSYWTIIMDREYNNNWNTKLLQKFNIMYVVEDERLNNNWWSHHGMHYSPFIVSISNDKERIYNNGDFSIWRI